MKMVGICVSLPNVGGPHECLEADALLLRGNPGVQNFFYFGAAQGARWADVQAEAKTGSTATGCS